MPPGPPPVAAGSKGAIGMWLARATLWLTALLGGCSGTTLVQAPPDAGSPSPDGPAAPLAFVVRGELALTSQPAFPEVPFPGQFELTAFLDLQRNPPTLVASHRGSVDQSTLLPIAGGWRTESALVVGAALDAGPACVRYGAVHFPPMDILTDGDDVHGSFAGDIELVEDDVIHTEPVRGSFTGTPDRQPPAVAVEPWPPHPADGLHVRLGEGVPAATRVVLVAPDGSARPLETLAQPNRPSASFALGSPVGTLAGHRLVFMPALVDLIGNIAPPPPPLDSVAVPLVPEDGFEGDVAPLLTGEARLMEGGRYPPIAGRRSLYVPLDGVPSRLSARLAVGPGDAVFRATARAVSASPGDALFLTLQVITSEGRVVWPPGRFVAGPFTEIDGVRLGAPQPIEVALPAGTSGEVLIDLQAGDLCARGKAAVLLDDLRLEPQ
jgi:hypothetical protein